MQAIRHFCDRQHDWIIRTIVDLVRVESPTTDPEVANRCGRLLASRLQEMGGAVETVPAAGSGDHLRASFGGGSESGRVMLLGHFDTVWPVGQLERMPIREFDGRLHGPGVFDMKAGIAIGMLAVRALAAAGRLDTLRVTMLFTADEERGSLSSRALVEEEARRSATVLVLEPSLPGGRVPV